jgi:HK97 family phage major capsid protein
MLPFDSPVILDYVTIMPCETGNLTFPSLVQSDSNEFGGMSWTWTTEAAEKGETEPTFSQLEIPTYELSGYTEVSERALSRSAISIEALLMMLVKAGMRFTVDNAVMNGNGTTQPLGIVNTAGIRTVARQTSGTVGDRDLVNLKHAVKAAHRGGARYILEDDVEEVLEEATDTFGRPLFRASTANGAYDRLVGYPYHVSENSPELGQTGDVMFGNPKWYILAMEEEVTIAKSTHYRFRNNVVAFKFFTVVGGRLMQPRAMAVLDEATS